MLPAAARLRRRAEFVATVREGRRRGHGAVVVHVAVAGFATATSSKADTPVRVGFVVSRAVGGAVVRNQVRRRLRHLMRDRLTTLPAGASVVVRALPAAAERSFPDLGRDLDAALAGALTGRGRRSGPGRPKDAGRRDRLIDGPLPGQALPHPTAAPSSEPLAPQRLSLLILVLRAPIVAYRRWVSPALPARCRFHPSCSAYALRALEVHGPLRGIALSVWRLLRCHPFHPGGYDPVPPAPYRRSRATVTGAST